MPGSTICSLAFNNRNRPIVRECNEMLKLFGRENERWKMKRDDGAFFFFSFPPSSSPSFSRDIYSRPIALCESRVIKDFISWPLLSFITNGLSAKSFHHEGTLARVIKPRISSLLLILKNRRPSSDDFQPRFYRKCDIPFFSFLVRIWNTFKY